MRVSRKNPRNPQLLFDCLLMPGQLFCRRMNLKRYLTIYGALWRTSVAREMSFKGNFLLWILGELVIPMRRQFSLKPVVVRVVWLAIEFHTTGF